MFTRRSFWGALLGTAVAAPAVAQANVLEPVIASGLAFDQIVCPACANMQAHPYRHDFPSYEVWAEYVSTPRQINCGNVHCQIPMLVQFARRVRDGKRID